MKAFLLALQFLTVITVNRDLIADNRCFARSTAFYPLVGLVIGMILVGLHFLFLRFWPPFVADGLTVISLIVATRALHLDGLADTLDGIFGAASRERSLKIMKDSRIGTFGAVGIIAAVVVKLSVLSSIPPDLKWKVLLFFPVVSRYSMSQLAWRTPYARSEEGLGGKFQDDMKLSYLCAAFFITSAIAFSFLSLAGMLCVGIVFFATIMYRSYFIRRLGGVTGDVFGFVNECNECLALLSIAALCQTRLVS